MRDPANQALHGEATNLVAEIHRNAHLIPAVADPVLDEVRDVMDGGGSGMAIGRAVYQDPDPAEMAGLVAALVHR